MAFPIRGRLSGSMGLRMEGLPRYDLIGESHGWRRPGYETLFEPGISFTKGASAWSAYVPLALVRNRQRNPYSGFEGDATFPDYILLLSYAHRFGLSGQPAPPDS